MCVFRPILRVHKIIQEAAALSSVQHNCLLVQIKAKKQNCKMSLDDNYIIIFSYVFPNDEATNASFPLVWPVWTPHVFLWRKINSCPSIDSNLLTL